MKNDDLVKEETINEILKNLYILACLDAFEEKNKGKGEILCEERIAQVKQDILKLIMENMPTLPITELTEWRKGYNQSLINYIQSIKKLFE